MHSIIIASWHSIRSRYTWMENMTYWRGILNCRKGTCRQLGTILLWWYDHLCQKLICLLGEEMNLRITSNRHQMFIVLFWERITTEKDCAAQAEASCKDSQKAHWHLMCWFRACCWEHNIGACELDGPSTCLCIVHGHNSQAFWISPDLQMPYSVWKILNISTQLFLCSCSSFQSREGPCQALRCPTLLHRSSCVLDTSRPSCGRGLGVRGPGSGTAGIPVPWAFPHRLFLLVLQPGLLPLPGQVRHQPLGWGIAMPSLL